ncbi:hypothetical protein BKA93DRAFT_859688 [Sparassis latifolia]
MMSRAPMSRIAPGRQKARYLYRMERGKRDSTYDISTLGGLSGVPTIFEDSDELGEGCNDSTIRGAMSYAMYGAQERVRHLSFSTSEGLHLLAAEIIPPLLLYPGTENSEEHKLAGYSLVVVNYIDGTRMRVGCSIRRIEVLAVKDPEISANGMLVDFDWCGKCGVRWALMGLNILDAKCPEGVEKSAFIRKEPHLAWLHRLVKSVSRRNMQGLDGRHFFLEFLMPAQEL